MAWALHRSLTTTETSARRSRLEGKLAKTGKECPLGDCFANDGRDKAAIGAFDSG